MGVQFDPDAPLNAMRQQFHRDVAVWAPMVVDFYLGETGDETILDEFCGFADSDERTPLYDHLCRGLDWLLRDRTRNKLSLIGDGDWNDPLNMAGHEGKGESVWLSQALVASLRAFAPICRRRGEKRLADRYEREADATAKAVNQIAWNGSWFARGRTDAGELFGTSGEREGRMYVNPQAWAMIAHLADTSQIDKMIGAVDRELMTPWGPHLLHPAYTTMREDIGRICQKSPGYAENGSVYCHGALFYVHGLYEAGRADAAWDTLRRLMPDGSKRDIRRAQQLPLYLPSLFHGEEMAHQAGTTNHYFRTGSCAWYELVCVYYLAGARGEADGLRIDPQMPSDWKRMGLTRRFRGATFDIEIRRSRAVDGVEVSLDGERLATNLIPLQAGGTRHTVTVRLP
jgi:cellobionic acid phosphorylase